VLEARFNILKIWNVNYLLSGSHHKINHNLIKMGSLKMMVANRGRDLDEGEGVVYNW